MVYTVFCPYITPYILQYDILMHSFDCCKPCIDVLQAPEEPGAVGMNGSDHVDALNPGLIAD